MFEASFHLQRPPFGATPDPACLFATESNQGLFDELLLRSEAGQGIAIVTGPAGTGKTLLCRRLLIELPPALTRVSLSGASLLSRRALLQAVHFELNSPYVGREEQELRLGLVARLRGLVQSGRPAILIVDEAHLLGDRLLEELRVLASLVEGDQPLARVVLVGQPALEMRLLDPGLEALGQRIACQLYLEPLTRDESRDYIAYRLDWAGGSIDQLFTPDALELVVHASNGIPRCLNQLCDHTLLLTCAREESHVGRETVVHALADLRQLPLHWNDVPAEFSASHPDQDGDDSDEALSEEALSIDTDQTEQESESPASWLPDQESTTAFETANDATIGSFVAQSDTDGFEEELVDDRYAALDLLTPRVGRLIDAEILQGHRHSPADDLSMIPPQPPEIRFDPAFESPSDPLVEEEEVATPWPHMQVEPDPAVADEEIVQEVAELTDHQEFDVVTPDPEFRRVDQPEYDTVEPEVVSGPADPGAEWKGAAPELRQSAMHSEPQSGSGTIPPPNFRKLFSTLRRKLAR
ncbi:MAG: AAA family ATPase [Planctomycetales bacterium]